MTSILMGLRADSGSSPEAQFLNSSWHQVIPEVWYTVTPLSHNPPLREETKNYQSASTIPKSQVFCPLASAFLLCYSGAYFFLGRFNLLLGRYQVFGELFHLGIVSLPVGSLVTRLNSSAIIHHLGRLLPSGWVPDTNADHYPDLEINFLTQSSFINTGLYFLFLGALVQMSLQTLPTFLYLKNINILRPSDLTSSLVSQKAAESPVSISSEREKPSSLLTS
ncbi:hypothetical protein DSO57_1018509 [Entomophthora muscae]|uniref:Uncharacterized protein n=1 Tax=Entomophthora muscae TaxID=34485 RepID=A0ACC2SHN0_9FUNG|nr:hypothetical protein DSO57_1018509 [Entomophthora muscae]